MKVPTANRAPNEVWRIPGPKRHQVRQRPSAINGQQSQLDQALGRLKSGDRLQSRFEILEKLGTGGMSIVYRARDLQHNDHVALKFISPALLQDPRAIKLMVREAKISSSLAHPGIVKVYELHQEHGLYFFHMELFEGQTLRQWMNERKRENRPVTLLETATLLSSLCVALEYAHQSTLHRDLKPENIGLIDLEEIKLMDFGLAQVMRRPNTTLFHETLTQISAGTPYYMAPELINHEQDIDGRADQFSLAVITYELLTGDLPLGLSTSLAEQRPDLPLRFSRSIDRAMSRKPEDRFPNIRAFAREIATASEPEPLPARLYRSLYRTPRRLKQFAAIGLLAACTYPIGALIHQQVQARSQELRTAYAAHAKAQADANQLQQRVVGLRMETEVLARRLAIESAAKLEESVGPSADWVTASNQWHSAAQLQAWLDTRTDSAGRWLTLTDTLSASRRKIEQHQLESSNTLLETSRDQITEIRGLLEQVRQIFQKQNELKRTYVQSLKSSEASHPHQNEASALAWDALTLENWRDVFTSITREHDRIQSQLENEKERAIHEFQTANREWKKLFPEDLGAPDLSFIYDPEREKQKALNYFDAGEWEAGLDLIHAATKTVESWSLDVQETRSHCAPAWERAQYRFEGLGMRFVRSGNLYWSVWELRFMDLGRWLAFNPEISQVVLEGLELDSRTVLPTDPVTGLDQRTASYIAAWAGYRMEKFGRPKGRLPITQDWQTLWANEALPGNYRFAIIPQENPERTIVLRDYYLDSGLKPSNYLRPVGSSDPSPSGLFNLTDNVWEWSDSQLELKRENSPNGYPLKWILHGGGTYGVIRFHQHEPPVPDSVYVQRRDAIGSRLVIEANPTLDRHTGYAP